MRILDGGWVKWVQEKRPFEHGRVTPKPGNFTIKPVTSTIIAKDELQSLAQAGASRHDDRLMPEVSKSIWERRCRGFRDPDIFPPRFIWRGMDFLNTDATVKDLAAIKDGSR